MKNFIHIAMLAMTFGLVMSCASDNGVENTDMQAQLPKEQAYIKKASPIHEVQTQQPKWAFFYIRIDSRIPGAENFPGNKYLPQNTWGTTQFSTNCGQIYAPEDFDYTTTGSQDNEWYVYDPTGVATKLPIITEPDLKDKILGANMNYQWTPFINGIDYDNVHVLWYVVKKQKGETYPHVDGVLTTKDVTDVRDIPGLDFPEEGTLEKYYPEQTAPTPVDLEGEVEVDIHQQDHKVGGWNEYKVSVHVRDTVNTKIVIPVQEDLMLPQDDFLIRTYDLYFERDGENTTTYSDKVLVNVKHDTNQIEITIEGITADMLKYLRETTDDGLTIEVHGYYKSEADDSVVWDLMKGSTVTSYPNNTNIKVNKHSALFAE